MNIGLRMAILAVSGAAFCAWCAGAAEGRLAGGDLDRATLNGSLIAPQASTWPTVHNDPQRSGYTREVIGGPYQRKWFRDFHDELIATRVEAIVAEEKVFVGTLAGNVVALRVADGSTAWTYKTGGAVGASACYFEGKLFIGSDDGHLYCLGAKDGQVMWRYAAGAGVWAAPACGGGKVYFGDRAGVFHAVDGRTGQRAWTLKTGGMILAPASMTADGKRIVFGSEDMHVYCVAPDGTLLWKSEKLGGLSLRDHAPTLWRGLAIVRTSPAVSYHRAAGESPAVLTEAQKALPMEPEDKILFNQWGVYTMKLTPRRLAAERQAVLKFLAANPAEKTFHAFQVEDGRAPWTAPVLYTAGMHNTPTAPTFNPDTGDLYLWVPTAFSTYAAGVPGGAVALGKLDRQTGLVEIIPHANGDAFNSHAGFCPPADETFALSLMGDTLLNTHQGIIGRMDLKTRKCGVLIGQRDSYGGIFGPAFVPEPWKGGQEKAHMAGQLVFLPNEWHGPDRSIVSIAGRRLFWVVGSQVVCIGGPDIPATPSGGDKYPGPIRRRTSLNTPGGNVASTSFGAFDTNVLKPNITKEKVRRYLAANPAPSTIATGQVCSAIRARLEAVVSELVEEGPWAPMVVELGPSGEEVHFWRSAETMQILASALPHLSPEVRAKAKRYLDRLFADGVPLRKPIHPGAEGKRRELYTPGPQMIEFAAKAPRYQPGIEDLYAVWAYAHYADGWPAVLREKAALERIFEDYLREPVRFDHVDKLNDAAEHLNTQIAGALAFVRIMDRAGEKAVVEQGLGRLAELLVERVHHELADSDFVRSSKRAHYQLHQAQIPRYNGLTPEVCAMLREFAGTKLQANVRQLCVSLPLWYQAFGERMIGGESYISTPLLSRGLFAALAEGVDAGPDELMAKLDQPWCKADLYFMEKLSAILRVVPLKGLSEPLAR